MKRHWNGEIITFDDKTYKMNISPLENQEKYMIVFSDVTDLQLVSEEIYDTMQ